MSAAVERLVVPSANYHPGTEILMEDRDPGLVVLAGYTLYGGRLVVAAAVSGDYDEDHYPYFKVRGNQVDHSIYDHAEGNLEKPVLFRRENSLSITVASPKFDDKAAQTYLKVSKDVCHDSDLTKFSFSSLEANPGASREKTVWSREVKTKKDSLGAGKAIWMSASRFRKEHQPDLKEIEIGAGADGVVQMLAQQIEMYGGYFAAAVAVEFEDDKITIRGISTLNAHGSGQNYYKALPDQRRDMGYIESGD